jgi:hypothetical protein
MLKFVRQVFVLFVLAFFSSGWASMALASPNHDYHSHHKIASPFQVKAKAVRLHCLLHGHNLNKPCPHHSLKENQGNKYQHTIASDCGGSPVRNQSTTVSFGNAFMVSSTFDLHIFYESEYTGFQSFVYPSTPITPSPPPPQSL